MKERLGEHDLLEAEVRNGGTQRRLVHADADDRRNREHGVDERSTELGFILGVVEIRDAPRPGSSSSVVKLHIVRLRQGSANGVRNDQAGL